MSNEISSLVNLVTQENNVFVTSSEKIAEVFGMLPKDVLRAIRAKVKSLKPSDSKALDRSAQYCADLPSPAVNPERRSNFVKKNFTETTYLDAHGRPQPSYTLTKDGFVFIAMGFTGEKADDFKLAFIEEFNRLEFELRAAMQRESDRADLDARLSYLDNVRLKLLLDAKPKTKDQYQAEFGIADLERENLVLKNTLMREQKENATLRDERERYYSKKSKK